MLLIVLVTASQMVLTSPPESHKSIQSVLPAPTSTLRPNIKVVAVRYASIIISRGDWQIATGLDARSPSQALLAIVSNVPRKIPVGVAFEVKARILYKFADHSFAINPATWLNSGSPARIDVGDQRELVLAICDDHLKEDNQTMEGFLQAMEDRRERRTESNYTFGPWMLSDTIATVFLTVDGIAEEPIRFKLLPASPEEQKRPRVEEVRPQAMTRFAKVRQLWNRQAQ